MAKGNWEIELEKVRSRTVLDERMLRMAVSLSKERRPQYGWTSIGEGFSVRTAQTLLAEVNGDHILDPFAGSGTTLVAAARLKKRAVGIELMPMCSARFEFLRSWPSLDLELMARQADLMRTMKIFADIVPEELPPGVEGFGLSAADLAAAMSARSFLASLPSMPERTMLQSVMLMALQDRRRAFSRHMRLRRDGTLAGRLDKVPRFFSMESAFALHLTKTLIHLVELEDAGGWEDLEEQELLSGSAMDILPTLPDGRFDAVLTSPSYFNGFDYRQQYALEHWFLGLEEELEHVKDRFLPTYGGMTRTSEIELGRLAPKWAAAGLDLDRILLQNGVPKEDRDAFMVYLLNLSSALKQLARTVRPDGSITFIIDDAYVGEADVNMDAALDVIASEHGLELDTVYRYGRENERTASRLRLERQRTAVVRWKKR